MLILIPQPHPPALLIITAIGLLLSSVNNFISLQLCCRNVIISQAANSIGGARGALLELFERMDCVFMRLAMYTKVSMTAEMIDVIVKVMAEVLCILAIATKELDENRASELISGDELTQSVDLASERGPRKLVGRKDIDDALRRLDKVTTVEVRTAAAQAQNGGRMGGAKGNLQAVDVRVKNKVLSGTNAISAG
jgi:hypothetical protein